MNIIDTVFHHTCHMLIVGHLLYHVLKKNMTSMFTIGSLLVVAEICNRLDHQTRFYETWIGDFSAHTAVTAAMVVFAASSPDYHIYLKLTHIIIAIAYAFWMNSKQYHTFVDIVATAFPMSILDLTLCTYIPQYV